MSNISNIGELKINSFDILFSSQSFGILRKALFHNIGSHKTKGFLLRLGKELGAQTASELLETHSPEYVVNQAIMIHKKMGHVSDVITKRDQKYDKNGNLLYINTKGIWFDSYEAILHLKHHEVSTECSCYTLSGFATGYLSKAFNAAVMVRETKCKARGDENCEFVIKLEEDWQEEYPEEILLYNEQTIYDELELTYDKLLKQKNLLDKISVFHNQLTESVSKNQSIPIVIETAYHNIKIPILIEDRHGNMIVQYGLTEAQLKELKSVRKAKMFYVESYNQTQYFESEKFNELKTPIYLENKVFAYCSFIYYEHIRKEPNDHTFLERISTISTLCFINEKIQFEAQERMKISVLDDLITKQYDSIDDIKQKFKYLKQPLVGPFYVALVNVNQKGYKENTTDLYPICLELAKQCESEDLIVVVSRYNDHCVILIGSPIKTSNLKQIMKRMITKVQKSFPDYTFKIGVSNKFEDLLDIDTYLLQAANSVRSPFHENIILHDDLGFIGSIVNTYNYEQLMELAKKELKILYTSNDDKNKELLNTLYIYLKNNGKLEKTMHDLSLSIGGIQYRIRKIEEIIGKSLKDFRNSAYLLLLIESMILIDKIKIES
ncbi:V4R domain-containing protein [Neobacillus rhizophilus]|uniref:Helix-turn-helix domain-containing protein n=1 Tax=Neobacillus rhizophilus TaxID=2833579 RepID=A0A942YXU2_9BACI|nr:V4R domain-containing protein [Neobacillus rhizophilus]MBS4214231.1 helix-turn-helix domain-containing protein [Neobacillus rhizophilus]